MIYYHGSNLAQALIDLFPNIGLDKSKLLAKCMIIIVFIISLIMLCLLDAGVWRDPKNRRAFFINYAEEHKFDPLIPKNWYLHPRDKIRNAQVTFFINFNFIFILMSVYLNFGFYYLFASHNSLIITGLHNVILKAI